MISLSQSLYAVAVNITASFLAAGGVPPYVYSVRQIPDGTHAGGTIDSSTGMYTAPAVVNQGNYTQPKQLYDTIQAVDSLGAMTTAQILVGTPLLLFCEIIQNQLGLKRGRVYLWDQKIFQPTDAGLYVAVKVLTCKPFGNTNTFDGSADNTNSIQSVNMYAQLELDVISRDWEARDRKEEVLMALVSNYSQLQQTANSFFIGKIPPGSQFINLSDPDGAAIPYRFNISVAIQYFVNKVTAVQSYDDFLTPQVNTNS